MVDQLEANLQHDMDLVRTKVQEMSGHCERAMRGALEALTAGERQAAYLAILRDPQLADLERQLDRLCLDFLVRQQPAGAHPRFAYAALKISSELERIGRHAEAIARRVLELDASPGAAPVDALVRMGDTSIGMLRDAVRAFVRGDVDLAATTILMERTVDEQRGAIDATLAGLQRSGQLAIRSFGLLSTISRRIERISDEVCDMCAETLFMCTGNYVKHRSPEAIRILFVDQHNHCRSQMAEAIATMLPHPRLLFSSAGLDPRPIDPRLAAFLAEKGLELTRHWPKSLDQIPNLEHYNVVVSFDGSEYCVNRFRRTPTVCIDWPVADPSTPPGPFDENRAGYERAFAAIRAQLLDLVEAVVRQE